MGYNFDRLHKFLFDNKNSDILEDDYRLYKSIVSVEKDGAQSSFDKKFYWDLFFNCAYQYHIRGGFDNCKWSSYYNIKRDISFDDFRREFYNYSKVATPNAVIENDTMFDLFRRHFLRVTGSNGDSWHYYDRAIIEGTNFEPDINTQKIYLSVDNKDLHNFALQLLNKCDDLGINYDFKINSDDSFRRCDNVVIYATDDEFSKYVLAIEAIKKENPNMDFGSGHILAYNYNDYISVAPCENISSKESHTSSICKEICDIYSSDKNFSRFCDKIDFLMSDKLHDTAIFCDNVRKVNNSNVQDDFMATLTECERKKFVCVNEALKMLRGLTPNKEVVASIKSFEEYLKQNFPGYNEEKIKVTEKNSKFNLDLSVTGKKR